jgi:hypothetical protein
MALGCLDLVYQRVREGKKTSDVRLAEGLMEALESSAHGHRLVGTRANVHPSIHGRRGMRLSSDLLQLSIHFVPHMSADKL